MSLEPRRLSPSERWYWLVDSVCPLNGGLYVRVAGDFDAAAIRSAVEALARTPLLSSRVEDAPGGPRFVPVAAERVSVDEVADTSLDALLAGELEARLPLDEGPMFRASFVRHGTETSILLSVAHVVIDGRSVPALVQHLVSALGGAPLAAATGYPPALEDALGRKLQGFLGFLAFAWLQLRGLVLALWRRPHRVRIPGALAPQERRTRFVTRSLAPELVHALTARARSEGTSLHGAFCAAIADAVATTFAMQGRGLMVGSPIDLRAQLPAAQRDAIGAFVTAIATFHALGEPFWARARQFTHQLRAALRRNEHVHALRALRQLTARPRERAHKLVPLIDKLGPGNLTVSTVGELPVPEVIAGVEVLDVRVTGTMSFTGMFAVISAGFRGATHLTFGWVEGAFTQATAAATIERFLALLEAQARSPDA